MGKRVLVVDDDALMRRSLAFNLEQAGYHANNASSAEDALEIARHIHPDIVLLDIGLPGMDGLEALRHFKNQMQVPIIFVTARRRELDEILGLELGADDYITKPFDMDVLLARIKAVLRRSESQTRQPETISPLEIGDLQIDPQSHAVQIGDRPVSLSPREYSLLYTLAMEPKRIFSVDELLVRVWEEYVGQPQVVYVHIRWLREKIEIDPNNPKRILTIRGVGYRLEP